VLITPNRAARIPVLAALAAVLVLSGCATVVSGSGQHSGLPTAASSGDFPSGASSSAPSTSSAPPSTTAAPSPTSSAVRDITDVKYKVPTGWERTSDYVEVIPLEASFQVKYLIPSGATPGLDVISIVLYRLPGTHLVDTRAQQVARIHAYERKRSLTIVRALKDTTVGGLPAFDESVVQPGSGSAAEFRYATWYIFGGAHLVQISCQVESQVDTVAQGCQKLLDSVTFS
jgi:hypothetical protein